MKNTKRERIARFYTRMSEAGFPFDQADRLRRIQMTLHRWDELCCGDSNDYASWCIERDEATGKPYMVTYPHNGKERRRTIPDREKGALRRLDAIMAGHPDYVAYHQTDPRGCALYLVPKSELADGSDISSVYNRGIAVCF